MMTHNYVEVFISLASDFRPNESYTHSGRLHQQQTARINIYIYTCIYQKTGSRLWGSLESKGNALNF